jgi:hypothetical protein
MFINEVCNALDRNKIRYAVAGGYAVALHGAVRGTVDIDIVVNWNLKTLRNTEKTMKELGLVSRLPVSADEVYRFRDEYIQNRNLITWNFYHPDDASRLVDIIIIFDLKGKGRKPVETLTGPIQLLRLDDLIKMKRASGRPQDLADIEALESLK